MLKFSRNVQLDFSNVVELPPTRPLLKLSSCEDFFDRDYDALIVDVENCHLKFSWDLAAPGAARREIRIWRNSALAFHHRKQQPAVSDTDVYKFILPARDIRSTELERIFSCTHQHIYELAPQFTVTRAPRQEDGPNSFTVFSRASIETFLRSRRIS